MEVKPLLQALRLDTLTLVPAIGRGVDIDVLRRDRRLTTSLVPDELHVGVTRAR